MDAWKIKRKKDRVTAGWLGRYYRSRYFQILFNYPTTPPPPPVTSFYTTVSPVDDNVRITGCSAETTLLYKEDTPSFLVAIILSFLYIYRSYCSILPVVLDSTTGYPKSLSLLIANPFERILLESVMYIAFNRVKIILTVSLTTGDYSRFV